MPAQVIDKGIPTAGLLAQVLVAKYADHQPLYRQEGIFERAGVAIPRSTLAQWVGACGVQPAAAGRCAAGERCSSVRCCTPTRRRWRCSSRARARRIGPIMWSYSSTQLRSRCRRSFTTSRTAAPARTREDFLERLVGQARVRRLLGLQGAVRGRRDRGRLPGARAAQVPRSVGQPQERSRRGSAEAVRCAVRCRAARRGNSSAEQRQRMRQLQSRPIADKLHEWLLLQRQQGDRRNGHRQGDRLQPEALGGVDALPGRRRRCPSTTTGSRTGSGRSRSDASNWLFAGSLRAGQRAAAVMSLIQSAKLNGHDPYRYLKDVLERLPTQPASRIGELLPHRWTPAARLS